jgi:hypothetical protein
MFVERPINTKFKTLNTKQALNFISLKQGKPKTKEVNENN